MSQTSREIVRRCLTFDHPERVPIDLWVLPWAQLHHPEETAQLLADYPSDIAGAPAIFQSPRIRGDMYAAGTYIDEWGCEFLNVQPGVIGEVKNPPVADLAEWEEIRPPEELVPTGAARQAAIDTINSFCRTTDKFVLAGACPRPWERYQFLRGTENAMVDVMLREPGVDELLARVNDFFTRQMEFWAETEVDALSFMDDWGSQQALLIPPTVWREIFKPVYRRFCEIARDAGKFIFMHSDGFIEEIYPDLIEIGVSAINSQLFCMNLDHIAEMAPGKITFWGEIDRQHILVDPDPAAGRRAVRLLREKLQLADGGIFCQMEVGAGACLQTVRAACEEWMK